MSFRGLLALGVAVTAVGAVVVAPARAGAADPCPAPGVAATDGLSVAPGSALVGSSAAALTATISSPGGPATYQIVYGTSTSYGSCTAGAALTAAAADALVTGLAPATTYHFQLVATDATGTAASADQTLTTLPAGEIAQGTTIDAIPVGGLNATAAARALQRLVSGSVRLRLGKRRWSVARSALGARVAGNAVSAALQATPGQSLTATISIDGRRLTTYLTAVNRRFGIAAQPTSVRLIGDRAVVVRARKGVAIDTRKARRALVTLLVQGRSSSVKLPTRKTAPPATPVKAVVVRLQSQTLTAYLNGKPVLTTPVTTGRPVLPTPIGSYTVLNRNSPYVFNSPWPPGSPFWYPPTPVTWAMEFYEGDFLHDDPGEPEGAYGAGSEDGPYASHGCVHIPHDAMSFLFGWLPVGATVIVSRV